jgi:hypothetical protein
MRDSPGPSPQISVRGFNGNYSKELETLRKNGPGVENHAGQ